MLTKYSTNKVISLILTCLLLAACGGEKKSDNANKPKEVSSAETVVESTTDMVTSSTEDSNNTTRTTQDQAGNEQQSNTDETADQLTGNQKNSDQDPFNWNKISGTHTQGIVSKNSPIQINFNRDVIDESLVNKDASKVMFISPSIDGKPIFESKSSIVWKPKEPLLPGTNYKVSIKPQRL